MSLFKKKTSGFEDEQEVPSAPRSKGALFVLLILVGGFAYLYFFTSLIVPHEAPPVKAPAGSPEIKQSMPPKPGAPEGGQGAKTPDQAKPAAAPAAPVVAPATPAATVKPAATTAPQTPPVAAKPAPAPPPAKPAPAKPAPAPAAAAPAAAKPAVAPAAKPVAAPAAAKPAAPAARKEEPKPAATAKKDEAKPAKAVAIKPAEAKKTIYTLLIESPSVDDANVAEDKIARAGIKPLVKHVSKKNRTMNRLYFGTYTDYDAYNLALDKLKVSVKGAFGVEKDGKYYLYAGSFTTKDRAEKEKKDLSAKGVTLQIQQAVLPLVTSRITAGQFHSKAEAEKAAAKLAKVGLKASVTKGK